MQFSILYALLCVSTAYAAVACNGNIKLCDRVYSNITSIGTHDSAFVGELPTDNQALSVPQQLDAGIRFLQGQTHKDIFGTLSMCHTSCWLNDAGSTSDYLSTIKSWLDSNPDQVVTLLLTNGDGVPISNFGDAMTSSGLASYAYAPGTTLNLDQWPTLQELIDSGKRLIMFLDYGADTSVVPYILDEFTYFFETPYDTTDPNFPECTLDRPSGGNPNTRMYIVNHFLDIQIGSILIPDDPADATTNSATSIEAQSNICTSMYGRWPNAVLVDYFNIGDVFTAQNYMNGL